MNQQPVNTNKIMPQYKCHKVVGAVKIKTFQLLPNQDAMIETDVPGFEFFKVSAKYMNRHWPKPGGYYVIYADGYESFSPAEAFEAGYTKIGD